MDKLEATLPDAHGLTQRVHKIATHKESSLVPLLPVLWLAVNLAPAHGSGGRLNVGDLDLSRRLL